MTEPADGDPAWLRDFPWLGGIAPQWVQQQREQYLRRQEEERALREKQRQLMQQWAAYDAQQHAVLQGHVDVTATGRHLAITDQAAQRMAAPPGATRAALGTGAGPATGARPGSVSSTGSHRAVRPDVASTGTHRAVSSDVTSTGTHRAG